MQIAIILITIVQLLFGLAVILAVLFQSGKNSGLSDSIGGSGADTFLSRGNAKSLDAKLAKATDNLELVSVKGLEDSPYREIINGKVYRLDNNPMGITEISFHFNDAKTGEIRYKNAQGDKVLPFGVNHNVYGKFPQLGYAGLHGCVPTTDGSMYNDAVSLAWAEENRVLVYTQIIDLYYGNTSWTIGFKDGRIAIEMYKNGEYFLNEYQGRAVGDLVE